MTSALSGVCVLACARLCASIDEECSCIDDECSFSHEPIAKFTRDVKAAKGDFSIAFWVKPLGQKSLHTKYKRFFPHITFFAKTSPPQHNLLAGLYYNPNGEMRLDSPCGRTARDIYENVEMKAASDSGWTFLAFSRRNTSTDGTNTGENFVATNLLKNYEMSELKQCLFDPEAFFSALEINYPMLISPIMMVPKALPFSLLQQMFLRSNAQMARRLGPRLNRRHAKLDSTIMLDKVDYTPRSVLIAPPIIFQTRRDKAAQCPFSYSSHFLSAQHEEVKNQTCALPYGCEAAVLERAEMTLSCRGPHKTNGSYFGILPSSFGGETGYADFLFSLTDNPFLYRDGKVRGVRRFLHSCVCVVCQCLSVSCLSARGCARLTNLGMAGARHERLPRQLHHRRLHDPRLLHAPARHHLCFDHNGRLCGLGSGVNRRRS